MTPKSLSIACPVCGSANLVNGDQIVGASACTACLSPFVWCCTEAAKTALPIQNLSPVSRGAALMLLDGDGPESLQMVEFVMELEDWMRR